MTRSCPECGESFPDAVFFCGRDGTITVQDQDPADFDSRLGTQLGGYIVVARVADGAMGRVFEGRHPQTRARVAIKVLHADVLSDGVAVERFKREFETAMEMEHPYIVHVLEFGRTPNQSYFMTMEYLVGEELAKALERAAPLSLERIVRIVCQTAIALEYAHSFGFVHRDLKPDNIYLCETEVGDEVRLLDFGSVKLQVEMGRKLTAVGTTVGSPFYMSPEQAMGRADVDQRTDVFALGAILHEMLCGEVAFEAPTVAKILMRIMNDEPAPPSTALPSLPRALDSVVARALSKDKRQRYGSGLELAAAMLEALGLEPDVAHWAARPEPEIEEALRAVVRQPEPGSPAAPAVPHGSEGGAPRPSGRASVAARIGASLHDGLSLPAGLGPSPAAKLLFVVLGALAIGGVLALLLR